MKNLCLILLAMAFSFGSNAQNSEANQSLSNVKAKCFIENKGQWPNEVLYLTRMGGLDVWITKQGINYTFFKIDEDSSMQRKKVSEFEPGGKFDHERTENSTLLGHRVILDLLGSSGNPTSEGLQKQAGYYNYFIGNDTNKHASNVGLYKEAVIKDVYNGIDMRYYFNNGNLQYDYIVKPGADPSQIQFRLRGQYEDYLKEQDLAFTTRFGEASLGELFTYQDGKAIESWFVKQNNSWQIALGEYDHNETLIIDPLLYSTYIGGTDLDWGRAISLDNSGNAYITGQTNSTNYDVTTGSFQTSYGGGQYDVFVTKVDASGTSLQYSTYIGGNYRDLSKGISVDSSGNVYVTGTTESTNYPMTTGVFQTSNGGGYDVFVTKINGTGTALLYSTYIGGNQTDEGRAIWVDDSGNAYLSGWSSSTNYDVTTGAFQTSNGGGSSDVIATKLNASGTALLYSTYIGGNGNESGNAISVDSNGDAYITGFTTSTNYDVTSGSFQTSFSGNWDVYVTKVNASGTALIYSTYIGGTSYDESNGISVDGSGNAILTGRSLTNYVVTSGAFQTSNGGNYDVFVTKINATGTALLYSTYIGGSGEDQGTGISLDGSGNAYVTGFTASTNYDVTTGAIQSSYGGGNYDVFVTKVNASGTDLLYSTYIGGSDSELGFAIRLDSSGNAYLTGYTASTNYDVTSGAFQTSYGGGTSDVFVSKLDFCAATLDSLAATACDNYTWAANNLTYTASGVYTDTLANASGCDSIVTLNLTIDNSTSGTEAVSACDSYTWVINSLTYTASGSYIDTLTNTMGCDSVITLNLTITNSNSGFETVTACDSYTWAASSLTYTASGVYTDTLTNVTGCDSAVTLNLTINTVDASVTNTTPTLTANALGANYQWLDCNASMAIIVGDTGQTFTATANGSFAVAVSQNGCSDTSECVPVVNVGVLESSYENPFSAFPNPTKDILNIELNGFYRSATIVVRNTLGQELSHTTFRNVSKLQLDMPDKTGVYFIEVKTEEKNAILKVMKE